MQRRSTRVRRASISVARSTTANSGERHSLRLQRPTPRRSNLCVRSQVRPHRVVRESPATALHGDVALRSRAAHLVVQPRSGRRERALGLNPRQAKVVYSRPRQSSRAQVESCVRPVEQRPDCVNGKDGLARARSETEASADHQEQVPDSPGMRCASRQTKDGYIYGVSHGTNQLFRYHPESDELKLLGINWLAGEYTTVCELSPTRVSVFLARERTARPGSMARR